MMCALPNVYKWILTLLTVESSSAVFCIYFQWRTRPGHKVSGTPSKFPNLNENGQKSHVLWGFSDSEPGQHFVQIRH